MALLPPTWGASPTVFTQFRVSCRRSGNLPLSARLWGEREGPVAKRWEGEVGCRQVLGKSPTSPCLFAPGGGEENFGGLLYSFVSNMREYRRCQPSRLGERLFTEVSFAPSLPPLAKSITSLLLEFMRFRILPIYSKTRALVE